MLLLVVGDKALQVSDAERLAFSLEQASPLAMIFLRTDASGNGGQHVVFTDLGGRGHVVACHDQLHKLLHIYAHWTIMRTGRLGAFQAANRLLPRQFFRIAQIDFSKLLRPHGRRLLRHMQPWHLDALAIGHWILGLHFLRHYFASSAHPAITSSVGACFTSTFFASTCCRYSSIERFSASRYMALRWTSTAKSTRCASNSGPSTQANSLLPSTRTRHPPHMPVPSIMMGLRLTMVRMRSLRVISATARIIGIGPTASTRSIRVPFSINCRSLSVTRPLSA